MFASFDGSPMKLLGRSGTVRAGVADSSRTSPSPIRADTSTGTPDWEARQCPCLRGAHREPAPHGEPGREGRAACWPRTLPYPARRSPHGGGSRPAMKGGSVAQPWTGGRSGGTHGRVTSALS